ncbi:MAG: hypothetical protein WBC05_09195 [Sedimentisphaerales bacterium]
MTGAIVTIPVWILLVDILINRRQSIIWYFLDFFRHLLVFGGTAFAVQFLWKTDWRLGAIAVIPIFVLLLNLFGFITIHLYNYTPEVRAGRKKYSDEDEGDLWEHSFPGYKEEQAAFDRDLTSLLDNEVIIDSLRHFGYDADFLTNIMERLRAIGNAKAVKTLLRDPSKVNRVLETFSREDWTDMSKIISVSNYLEYGL